MGYVFDYKDSVAYDNWYNSRNNQFAARYQFGLLNNLLKPVAGDSIVDIGCGTGETLNNLVTIPGLQLTGIDPSPYMLDFARNKTGGKVDLHRGGAEDLPFDDNSFNHACLITTLEYAANPRKAVEEAARVAKDRLFICVMNRYAVVNMQRRLKGIFRESIYNKAQFFSIWELQSIIKTVLGDVPVSWRSVDFFPSISPSFLHKMETLKIVQKIPFGAYAVMVVTLKPSFRLRPLGLKLPLNREQKFAENHYTVVKEKETIIMRG